MNSKKVLSLALLSAIAINAHAQSSVTLYGNIDEGLTYLSNVGGSRLFQAESGNIWQTNFGIKGTEDLGGGNKALFTLETGFDLNSGRLGEGNRMFGRQAFVGVQSDKAGTVTLGRQYDSMSDALAPYNSCWNFSGSGFHFGDNDNLCQSIRFDNAVKYLSPTIGGFSVGATYAFGNQAGSVTRNSTWSVGANFNKGPVSLGVGYMNANNPGAENGPFDKNGIGTGYTNPSADNYIGYMSGNYGAMQDAARWAVFGVGGSYTVGDAILYAEYSNSRYLRSAYLADVGGAGNPLTDVIFNNFELSATYNITSAFSMNGAWTLTTAKVSEVDRSGRFNVFTLMADYKLSKRTDLYAFTNYQVANGDGVYYDGSGFSQIAAMQGLSSSNKQVGVTLGVRHEF